MKTGPIFGRLAKDDRGAVMIVAALMMPVFIGGLGLGGEAGYWYFDQRKLQNAADVAAYAAATQLRDGKSSTEIEAAALGAAIEAQLNTSIGSVTTISPPSSGAFAGDVNAVEVTVQENVPRMFSGIFANDDVPLSGRAVARVEQGAVACILALDPSASGAITFTGDADATLEGCNVHANSIDPGAVDVSGSGAVSTPCASAVGGVEATAGLSMSHCRKALEDSKFIADPYEGLDFPAGWASLPCEPDNTFGGPAGTTYDIIPAVGVPVRYCGGLSMSRTVNMHSGMYIVDGGDFDINSTAIVTGTEITVFLVNGARLQFNGAAEIQMTSALPTSPAFPSPFDVYAGMLIFVHPDEPFNNNIINGDSNSFFDGAIYGSSVKFTMSGGSTVGGGCSQIVGLQVHISGDAGLGTNCTGKGLSQIDVDSIVTLVE